MLMEEDDVVADLPISIISDIISRLPVDDVARCKCVCKDWCTLVKEPTFTHLHFTRSSSHTILLWDKHTNFRSKECHVYLISNTEDGNWKTSKISHQNHNLRANVVASCNGFLILNAHFFGYSKGPDRVYNPLTEDYILLPQLKLHTHYKRLQPYKCSLALDPVTKKYKLALAYLRDSRTMMGAIITLGESSWRTLLFPVKLANNIYREEPLFFCGAFHWMIGSRYFDMPPGNDDDRVQFDGILKLDISTEKFESIIFSHSLVLPETSLQQIQLENSAAFVRSTGNTSLEIWQILGVDADGNCLYKHKTSTMDRQSLNDLKLFRLLGTFSNGMFLFEARSLSDYFCNSLVLVDMEKDEVSVIDSTDAPKYFYAHVFTPSLISPG